MIDYLISAVLFVFIMAVLVVLRRRDRRDKLAAESRLAAESKPGSSGQLASDGQHRDDQRG